MFTTAGLIRSATSAKFTSIATGEPADFDDVRRAGLGASERAGVGVRDPARIRPTRKAVVAVRQSVTKANRRFVVRL